jgi:membrane protein implicated in regulation of membrane protease activity
MVWKADTRRRCLGAVFLLVALGMLLAGETVLRNRLGRVSFLVFWLVCFLFTCLALLVAFLDLTVIHRRTREEQRALFEDALKGIVRRPGTRPEQRD